MTKKKARGILLKQRITMTESTICTQQWLDDTYERLTKVFGSQNESLSISSFGQYYSLQVNIADPKKAVRELNKFFDVWIGYINDGLYKSDEKSFIDGFKNAQLKKWGLWLIAVSFTAGYIFGAYNNPKSMFNKILKNRIDNLTGDQPPRQNLK